jgi:hypothetical protein
MSIPLFFPLVFRQNTIRSGFKTSNLAQEQEAHLNQYNQMCYPAYAGAQDTGGVMCNI